MTRVTGLGHVGIYVRDLERSGLATHWSRAGWWSTLSFLLEMWIVHPTPCGVETPRRGVSPKILKALPISDRVLNEI
jgi:hypothetical protein